MAEDDDVDEIDPMAKADYADDADRPGESRWRLMVGGKQKQSRYTEVATRTIAEHVANIFMSRLPDARFEGADADTDGA